MTGRATLYALPGSAPSYSGELMLRHKATPVALTARPGSLNPTAVLGCLRDKGLRLGLLSNTHWPRQFHERFLERDGLADLLDARFYTSEMEYVKPTPRGSRRYSRPSG